MFQSTGADIFISGSNIREGALSQWLYGNLN